MKKFGPLTLLLLGACQSTTRPERVSVAAAPPARSAPAERVWLRTDGQRASSSPVLLEAFNTDKAACVGEADSVSSAAEDCMRRRGYIFVARDEAPRMAAELQAKSRRR
jgi:hypothetical protein